MPKALEPEFKNRCKAAVLVASQMLDSAVLEHLAVMNWHEKLGTEKPFPWK